MFVKRTCGTVVNKVFFDMDGVLVDFDTTCQEMMGVPIETVAHKPGDPVGQFLKKEIPNGFFLQLKSMPDFEMMKELIFACGNTAAILTAVGKSNPHLAVEQKRKWLELHGLGTIPFFYTFSGTEKGYYAKPERLLIDDTDKCWKSFTENGGDCILHKSFEQTTAEIVERYHIPWLS